MAVTAKIPGDLFADSLTRTAGFSRRKNAFCAKAALSTVLPVVRDVLRAILEELGGHSNTGQRESANASHRIRDRIASLIYRGGPDAGLLRPLTIAAVFVCSEGKTEL